MDSKSFPSFSQSIKFSNNDSSKTGFHYDEYQLAMAKKVQESFLDSDQDTNIDEIDAYISRKAPKKTEESS